MAELVELLIDSGISAEFRGKVIALVDKHGKECIQTLRNSMEIPRNSTESAEERRRRKDRERKKKPAENSVESVEIEKCASLSKEDSIQGKKEESKKERKQERGARLSETWKPTPEDWMVTERSLGGTAALGELEKFRDHWKQQPGSRGVKLCWDATWRNWVRRAAEYRHSKSPPAKSGILASLA